MYNPEQYAQDPLGQALYNPTFNQGAHNDQPSGFYSSFNQNNNFDYSAPQIYNKVETSQAPSLHKS